MKQWSPVLNQTISSLEGPREDLIFNTYASSSVTNLHNPRTVSIYHTTNSTSLSLHMQHAVEFVKLRQF